MALLGLDLSRGAGRDLGLVDVVDGDVDADLLPPLLHERVKPLIGCGHEVAPHQDLQVAGEFARRLSECGRRRGDARRDLRLDCLFSRCASRECCTRHPGPSDLQEPAARYAVHVHSAMCPPQEGGTYPGVGAVKHQRGLASSCGPITVLRPGPSGLSTLRLRCRGRHIGIECERWSDYDQDLDWVRDNRRTDGADC